LKKRINSSVEAASYFAAIGGWLIYRYCVRIAGDPHTVTDENAALLFRSRYIPALPRNKMHFLRANK
jgi:hypothetical protein